MEAPSSPPLPLSSSDDEGDISQLGAVPTSMLSSPVRVAPTSQLGMSDDEDDIRVQTSQSQSQSQWDSQGQYQDGIPLSPEASPPPSPLDPHDLDFPIPSGRARRPEERRLADEEPDPISESSFITSEVQKAFIWGTKINVNDTSVLFDDFLRTFSLPMTDRDLTIPEPRYPPLLRSLVDAGATSFSLDCHHLAEYNESLYNLLISYPTELLPILDVCIVRFLMREMNADIGLEVRPFNLKPPNPQQLRSLNPNQIDQLLSVRGMITRVSALMPDLRVALFRCQKCYREQSVPIDRGRIDEPRSCVACETRDSMELLHNRCNFADKQVVRLQETPEDIPEGETPVTVTLCLYEELVDSVNPGDRVEISGIYRAQAQQLNRKNRNLRSVYRTYMDVLHIRRCEKGRLRAEKSATEENTNDTLEEDGSEVRDDEAKEREKEEIIALSQEADIYDRLTKSIAPSIWEMDDVKKGVLCLLFGGTHKKFKKENEGRFRGEINVLLVGDPGTSKSQLLQYVHKIAPRGMYTSGKGSSAVGLTAYVAKDPETGQAVLESGALVLSDRGVCCIDEFDKMSDHTRSILHEVMEQQTVSVAKSGIIATLNARTSVLASANPRESRYNPRMSVVENIDLPPTLLSRFDLIYLVLDKPDTESDSRLARHLVSLYYKDPPRQQNMISVDLLTKYVSYARSNIFPQITDQAREGLVQGYLHMRREGRNRKTVSATPRQLESLIRLSEAHARMRFSEVVEMKDVDEAVRLVRVAMQKAAIDPRTGTIDMDLITTGRSASARGQVKELANQLRSIIHDLSEIRFDRLFSDLRRDMSELGREDLKDALQQLVEEGSVVLSGDVRNHTIRPI